MKLAIFLLVGFAVKAHARRLVEYGAEKVQVDKNGVMTALRSSSLMQKRSQRREIKPVDDEVPLSLLSTSASIIRGQHKEWVKLSDVSSTGHNVSVSLCVPCEFKDLNAFKTVLFPSLLDQTYQPTELILSMSKTNNETAKHLQAELEAAVLARNISVPIRILFREEAALAGSNRNRAARASRGDLIVFADADDAMHPQRLEILANVFKRFQPRLILSGYSEGVDRIEGLESPFRLVGGRGIDTQYGSDHGHQEVLGLYQHSVHQGQPAVDRQVFMLKDGVQQREDLKRGQDVQFLRDVLQKFGNESSEAQDREAILYVGLPLIRFSNWKTGR